MTDEALESDLFNHPVGGKVGIPILLDGHMKIPKSAEW